MSQPSLCQRICCCFSSTSKEPPVQLIRSEALQVNPPEMKGKWTAHLSRREQRRRIRGCEFGCVGREISSRPNEIGLSAHMTNFVLSFPTTQLSLFHCRSLLSLAS
ncbi:hypothetical protein OESDEN_17549 [Oesophagostomum dentatum]|uniref:Uncharacterized protein n=1 Tax=Oesophagostomum dentatum TaxID=61180 RepID=A0A0B1SFT9_OESDE|nr:hypothetical protein OESDEN_17549 [Oesophagostomum dentatum]